MSCGKEPFFGLALFWQGRGGEGLASVFHCRFIFFWPSSFPPCREWAIGSCLPDELTCSTKTQNCVSPAGFSSPASASSRCRAASTSLRSSRTAYSSVVRVSSTSSTIRMFLPTRLRISSELRSSHWVRVTRVPGASTAGSLEEVVVGVGVVVVVGRDS